MRLWPIKLLPYLPRQQLLGQHRECCALRGKGWGRKHATVDYVFRHPYGWLWQYHYWVLSEMTSRGYRPDQAWFDPAWRGNRIGFDIRDFTSNVVSPYKKLIYPEHDAAYLAECVENLRRKGVMINIAGSGSCGVACKERGYSYVGCEKSRQFYDAARKRLGISEEV